MSVPRCQFPVAARGARGHREALGGEGQVRGAEKKDGGPLGGELRPRPQNQATGERNEPSFGTRQIWVQIPTFSL